MSEYIEQASRLVDGITRGVGDTVRQVTNARLDEEQAVGFSRAASITLRRIQEKIDGLKEQMENGPALPKAEQLIFVQLDKLKSEIESDFDRYWRGTGIWTVPGWVDTGVVSSL